VVNIHTAVCIVNIGARPISARANHATVRCVHLMTASRRRVTSESSRRRGAVSSAAWTASATRVHPTRCAARMRAASRRSAPRMHATGARGCRMSAPARIRGRWMTAATWIGSGRMSHVGTTGSARGGTMRRARRRAVRSTTAGSAGRRTMGSLETATRVGASRGSGGMRRGGIVWRGRVLLFVASESQR
jgi:hypothetical protein